jgi:tetratricopeptide (TPR) repeat protein
LEEALSLDKSNDEALLQKGIANIEIGKYKRAWRISRSYIKNRDNVEFNHHFFYLMGNALEGLGRVKKARKWYKKAKDAKPKPISLIE